MKQTALYKLIRRKVQQSLNGYQAAEAVIRQIDDYIVAPALSERAGVAGAIALAQQDLD